MVYIGEDGMKRFVILAMLATTVCLSACGGQSGDDAATAETAVESAASLASTEDATEAKAEDASAEDDAATAATEEDPWDEAPVVAVGETVSIEDVCDFAVDYVDITKDVIPPQPSTWYSHYESETGKSYVDLCVAYTNKETGDVGADNVLYGTLLYADKYEYTGFSTIEDDNRGDFTYTNITSIAPLTTEYVHYLFSVPESVQESSDAIELRMNIGGEDYKIIAREGTGASTASDAKTSNTNSKTSGEVAQGETVVTANAEFSVDYSAVTNTVLPPQPAEWYSYYEADEGKSYVDVCWAYCNTSGSNVGASDVISARLKYADKYDYSGFSIIEDDSRGDFTYTNITSIAPLTTEYVHYLFEVPAEVADSTDSIIVSFTVDGNSYTYTVR